MLYPTPFQPAPEGDDDLVTVTEPKEGAFTILMPRGWQNQAHLQREHGMNRMIASAISQDGSTMIYLSDPRIPYFMEPIPFTDPQMMAFHPLFRMLPFTPADRFFGDYLQQYFGGAPGFRVTGATSSPEYARIIEDAARRGGNQTHCTSVKIAFEHEHNGLSLRCRLNGITSSNGPVWIADLFTVSTTGDPDQVEALALRMVGSVQFNPAWSAAQQQLHAQRMALGQQQLDFSQSMMQTQTQGHNQRMQNIQSFGQANTRMHEDRMAQMDVQQQAWMNREAQSDAQQHAWMSQQSRDDAMQQDRVNAIREECTVVDNSGNTYQVSAHHERYYLNKRDNTYIGAGGATELHDLARTHGIDPNDYEEVHIRR